MPPARLGWDIRINDSSIRVAGINGWGFNIVSDGSATLNAWHHVALVSSSSTATLYIDGVPKGSSPRSAIGSTGNPFRMGYTTNYGGAAFHGLIDEVEILNRALSAEEIAAIYGAGGAGKCKPCVASLSGVISWWAGEGDASDVIDGNDGSDASYRSSNAALCAGEQGHFWDYHDILYANQISESANLFTDARLVTMAQDVNLDMTAFNQCYQSKKYSSELQSDISKGMALSVSGTPSIFVDGKLTAMDKVTAAIDAALAGK